MSNNNALVPMNNSFPTPQEFSMMKDLANIAIKSGMLPTSIKTPEAALIIMLKGRELNLPPMIAFSHIHVINGRPTMSAEMMLSQIYKLCPSAVVEFITTNEAACVISAKRPNCKSVEFSFTIDDAKKADLLSKGPWKQYPTAMLRARCISAMARAMFPDALQGVSYTPEELGNIEIDEHGEEKIVQPKDVQAFKEAKPVFPSPPVIQERAPSTVIYDHLKKFNFTTEQLKELLFEIFGVHSFKDLTKAHLEIYDEVLASGKDMQQFWTGKKIVEQAEAVIEEIKSVVVEAETKVEEMPLVTPPLPDVSSELVPQHTRPRNMASGEYNIEPVFPTLVKFGKVKLIPRGIAIAFIEKAATWPESLELSLIKARIKDFWGI